MQKWMQRPRTGLSVDEIGNKVHAVMSPLTDLVSKDMFTNARKTRSNSWPACNV